MNRYGRWTKLLEMLAESGQLDIDETAGALGVSSATIRRDFGELASQQLVIRTRGGVTAQSVAYDLPLRYKVARHAPEKQRIGAAAAALIKPGSTVGINGGTTTSEVARSLASRADLNADQRQPPLTIVTNALNIANELVVRPHIRVVMTGGAARPQSYELIGPIAESMLASVALDVAIIGVDALDHVHGASTHNDGEAAVNHSIASRAAHLIVVADGSKIGRRALSRICLAEDIDIIVTDKGATDEAVAKFSEAGVKVIQV